MELSSWLCTICGARDPSPLIGYVHANTIPTDANTYCWIGLNIACPLIQYRQRSAYDSKKSPLARKTSRSKKKFLRRTKDHSLLNILFRFADPSKGDAAQVQLKCSLCSESNFNIDRTPRYEIASGVYLAPGFWSHFHSGRTGSNYVPAVPVDANKAFKNIKDAVRAYKNSVYPDIAKNTNFTSRKDLEAADKDLVWRWIRVQGFSRPPRNRREDIVDCADKIRLWLKDPEGVDVATLPGAAAPPPCRQHFVTVVPDEARFVTDLDGLSVDGLRRRITSRGWTQRVSNVKSGTLLEVAQRIWDNPDIVYPLQVCSREDIDKVKREQL